MIKIHIKWCRTQKTDSSKAVVCVLEKLTVQDHMLAGLHRQLNGEVQHDLLRGNSAFSYLVAEKVWYFQCYKTIIWVKVNYELNPYNNYIKYTTIFWCVLNLSNLRKKIYYEENQCIAHAKYLMKHWCFMDSLMWGCIQIENIENFHLNFAWDKIFFVIKLFWCLSKCQHFH